MRRLMVELRKLEQSDREQFIKDNLGMSRMLNYVWPIALVILSNVFYQICAKSVPEDRLYRQL